MSRDAQVAGEDSKCLDTTANRYRFHDILFSNKAGNEQWRVDGVSVQKSGEMGAVSLGLFSLGQL